MNEWIVLKFKKVENVEAVTNFIFLNSKITVDGDCSHEMKRHLVLGRTAMTNLDNALKSRDITLPTKVCMVKAMISPGTSLVAQMLRSLPVMWETLVQSLDQEDPLEKETATHSSMLAWKIQWMEEPVRLQSMGSQRVGHDWVTSLHFFMVSPVVMYRCESLKIRRLNAEELMLLNCNAGKRLLSILWTVKRSNQSILKEINPVYSLEGLMLKLRLRCLGHLIWRVNLLGKTLDAGKDWRQKEKRGSRGWDG